MAGIGSNVSAAVGSAAFAVDSFSGKLLSTSTPPFDETAAARATVAPKFSRAERNRNYTELRHKYETSASTVWSETSKRIGAHLLTVGAGALVAAATVQATRLADRHLSTDPTTDAHFSQTAAFGSMMVVNGAVRNAVVGLGDIAKDMMTKAPTSDAQVLKSVHKELKKQTADHISQLPASYQDGIRKLDQRIQQELDPPGTFFSAPTPNVDLVDKLLQRRELDFLSVPQIRANVAHYDIGGDPAERQRIDRKVDALLTKLDPDIRPYIDNTITQIRDNSVAEDPIPVSLYLHGPAGVGKTTLVNDIAEALGLPVLNIKLSDCQPGDIVGPQLQRDSIENVSQSIESLIGKLPALLLQYPPNTIVFFDEADVAMAPEKSHASSAQGMPDYYGSSYGQEGRRPLRNDFVQEFLPLLERKREKVYLHALSGIELNFGALTFIFAGNRVPDDLAFQDRCPIVDFKPLNATQKRAAADRAFAQATANLNKFLPESAARSVAAHAAPFVSTIVRIDADPRMGRPGGRDVQDITSKMVTHVRRAFMRAGQIDPADIRRKIAGDYKVIAKRDLPTDLLIDVPDVAAVPPRRLQRSRSWNGQARPSGAPPLL